MADSIRVAEALGAVGQHLWVIIPAALLGAAPGVLRPVRRAKHSDRLRPEIEHALNQKGISYELRGSSPDELRCEVTVPYQEKIRKLIRSLDGHAHRGHHGSAASPSVEGEIKAYMTVRP